MSNGVERTVEEGVADVEDEGVTTVPSIQAQKEMTAAEKLATFAYKSA